jgi:Na+/proline symporter
VLQTFVFDQWGVPFWLTVAVFIFLILLYTYEGGVKTIVWTDTLQTTFMLSALVLSIILIAGQMHLSFDQVCSSVLHSRYSGMIITDWNAKNHFLKHFFGGMFIAIAMTGLDQEMMQKNISVKTLKDAQKNMFTFSFILVFINFLFLSLGILLYNYSAAQGIPIPEKTDDLFPVIALEHLGTLSAVFFIIGLISAAYPSADGALTALTSSFCIDFLGFNKVKRTEKEKKNIRHVVHISFAVLLLMLIVVFRIINDDAVISKLFTIASFTYGPLLGLFSFGLISKKSVNDKLVPLICLFSPFVCYMINDRSVAWFGGYHFGFEMIILNGALTFLGLSLISRKNNISQIASS